LLKSPHHNGASLFYSWLFRFPNFFFLLTSKEKEKVLIFDDSTYDQSRPKVVDFLPGFLIIPDMPV
jgi:hypothetical protein